MVTGWHGRHETREVARQGRQAFEEARAFRRASLAAGLTPGTHPMELRRLPTVTLNEPQDVESGQQVAGAGSDSSDCAVTPTVDSRETSPRQSMHGHTEHLEEVEEKIWSPRVRIAERRQESPKHKTLVSLTEERYRWCQETFPTVMAVLSHLPFALIPFGLCMFVLVQGLASRGWISVFAYGWDHWVRKTGTVGA